MIRNCVGQSFCGTAHNVDSETVRNVSKPVEIRFLAVKPSQKLFKIMFWASQCFSMFFLALFALSCHSVVFCRVLSYRDVSCFVISCVVMP